MTVGYAANAAVMGIDLENLEIKSEGELDLRGFLGLDPTVKPGYDKVRYTVTIRTSAPSEQVQIFLTQACDGDIAQLLQLCKSHHHETGTED